MGNACELNLSNTMLADGLLTHLSADATAHSVDWRGRCTSEAGTSIVVTD